ncbi:MAG: hypothetical protein K2H96_10435 [Muribaculaceae bacterium]|nr:hypothetical protein [Muribaculaceae bacterium]
MKKLYMFLVAAAATFSANADLHFYINGEEVANGSRVDVTSYFEDEEYRYIVDPKMEIKADENGAFSGTVKLTSGESIPAYDMASMEYGAAIGAQWCAFDGSCVPMNVGTKVTKSATLSANVAENMAFEFSGSYGWEQNHDEVVIKAEATFDFSFGGKTYNLTLYFDKDPSGVNDVMFDSNAPVEYFDLQGRRVANPSQGLYIIRQGSKVTKSIVK